MINTKGERFDEDFFIYEFPTFTSIAAGGNQTNNVIIQADSDFLIEKLTFQSDIAGATQNDSTRLVPNATVLITDTGSGRQLSSLAVPITAFFGTGQEPFILPKPKRIAARSTLQAIIVSFEAAVVLTIRLSLIGRKIFAYY